MNNLLKGSLSILVIGSMGGSYAYADALTAEMKVYQVTAKEQAKKELKQTDEVKPNSKLEYQVIYHNTSTNNLKNLKLNLPLPVHVSYLGSSFPANAYASTDGVHFAKAPLTRVVNGKKVNVPLNEYRVLQWNVKELKPKQKTTISAQVRVNAPE